jgi:hypothetical protein
VWTDAEETDMVAVASAANFKGNNLGTIQQSATCTATFEFYTIALSERPRGPPLGYIDHLPNFFICVTYGDAGPY